MQFHTLTKFKYSWDKLFPTMISVRLLCVRCCSELSDEWLALRKHHTSNRKTKFPINQFFCDTLLQTTGSPSRRVILWFYPFASPLNIETVLGNVDIADGPFTMA